MILPKSGKGPKVKDVIHTITLNPFLLTELASSLQKFSEEKETSQSECWDTANEIQQYLVDSFTQSGVVFSQESLQISQFDISLPIIIFDNQCTLQSWSLGTKKDDLTAFPEDIKYTQPVQAIVIIPNGYTNGLRREVEESATTLLRGKDDILQTSIVISVDKDLFTQWQQSNRKQSPITFHMKDADEPEQMMPIESLREVVKVFLEDSLNGTQFVIEQLQPFDQENNVMPDLIFRYADSTSPHPAFPLLSLYGLQVKNGKKIPIPYDNVGGIVVTNLGIAKDDVELRKEATRSAGNSLRQYSPFPRYGQIITVDADLLNFWKQRGDPFASNVEVREAFGNETTKKQADYGVQIWRQRQEPPEVFIDWWEPKVGSHIGSPQLRVGIRWDKTFSEAFLIDWGWIFSQWKSKNFLDFPSPQDGINEFLDKKLMRPVSRLYRTDLLMYSVNNKEIYKVLQHADSQVPVYSRADFILLEMVHRLGLDGFDQLLRNNENIHPYYKVLSETGSLQKLYSYLSRVEKIVYAKKTMYWGMGITHAHQDHTIIRALTRKAIPSILSPTTHAFLRTDHKTSSRYTISETAYLRNYALPKIGNAWQVEEFPYIHMEHGERIEIAPGFFITAYEGHHSIQGELGFVWEMHHKGKLLSSGCYGGDDKDGEFFRYAQQHVKSYGPIDVGFIEGTNDARTTKQGAFTGRVDVQHSFEALLHEKSESPIIIVDIIKNGIERLYDVIVLALQQERIVGLSPRTMYRVQQLGLNLQYKLDSDNACKTPSEKEFIEILRFLLHGIYSGGIICWKRKAQIYETYENEMFATFGTVTTGDLSASSVINLDDKDHKKYIILREYGEDMRKLDGIAGEDIPLIESMYAAYDQSARQEKEMREEFANEHNMIRITKNVHTSGHGVLVPSTHLHAAHSIADEASKVGFDETVVVHTKGGRKYINEEVLPTYLGFKNTLIHERLNHPNPRIIPRRQFDRDRRS